MSDFNPSNGIVLAFSKAIAVEWESILLDIKNLPSPALTPEQAIAVEAISRMEQSILLESVAGSGKTTTERLGLKALLQKRNFPLKASTCHSLGFQAWRDKIGRNVQFLDGKMRFIAKDLGFLNQPGLGHQALLLAKRAKTYGLSPNDTGSPLLEDSQETWDSFADSLGLDLHPQAISMARALLVESIKRATEGTMWKGRRSFSIDFDDMNYLPAIFSCPFPTFDLVVGDEVQDWTALQRRLIRKALAPKGRLLAAGDPYQSIYAFRGADPDSIPLLIKEFTLEVIPLTVSLRCAKTIVQEAQEIVPHITPKKDAPLGNILSAQETSVSTLPPTILCRNNAPNVSLALRCIAQGRPAYILGKEIGESLISFVKEIASGNLTLGLDAFRRSADLLIEKRIQKRPAQGADLQDKAAALDAIIISCKRQGESTVEALISTIESLYTQKPREDAILFSTVHKAKGLEWPSVGILRPELFGKLARNNNEALQENNLRYVAITRAKNTLTYITGEPK